MSSNGVAEDSGPDLMLESHEDRLQKVEDTVNQTRLQVVATDTRVEAMQHQIVEANAHIIERMESGFKRVAEDLKPLASTVSELNKTVGANSTKIANIEKAETERANKKKALIGTASGLILAGCGVLVGKFSEAVWAWLTR